MADEIAYTQHDIDDGIRSGLIKPEQMEEFELWREAREKVLQNYPDTNVAHTSNASSTPNIEDAASRFHARVISQLIKIMIHDLYETTNHNLQKNKIKSVQDVRNFDGLLVDFSTKMRSQLTELRKFLMQNFYLNEHVASEINKGKNIIQQLFEYYLKYPEKMPGQSLNLLKDGESIEIVIKDFIAGMTDHYALEQIENLQLEIDN